MKSTAFYQSFQLNKNTQDQKQWILVKVSLMHQQLNIMSKSKLKIKGIKQTLTKSLL